jgi:hypothetical protein
MTLDQLKEYTKDFMDQYPNRREELVDTYLMAQAEIEGGQPEHSECETAYNEMKELCES